MIKDGYEDYKRYKSDEEENNKECFCYKDGSFQLVKWKDLKVGDLVKVMKGEFLPADLMCLASSDYKKGQCFIETKNLDGETNLKTRLIPEDLKPVLFSDNDVAFTHQSLRLVGSIINCEGPNKYLTKYKGTLQNQEKKMPLSPNNLLLRGCILRNTDYVLAVICYTGYSPPDQPPDQDHAQLHQRETEEEPPREPHGLLRRLRVHLPGRHVHLLRPLVRHLGVRVQ